MPPDGLHHAQAERVEVALEPHGRLLVLHAPPERLQPAHHPLVTLEVPDHRPAARGLFQALDWHTQHEEQAEINVLILLFQASDWHAQHEEQTGRNLLVRPLVPAVDQAHAAHVHLLHATPTAWKRTRQVGMEAFFTRNNI